MFNAASQTRFRALWERSLDTWAVVLRRATVITAGGGGTTRWAAVQPAGVHAAVADTGSLQTISTGLTQPAAPSVLTATVSGTLSHVTAVSVVATGTDASGAVQTETLPAFPLPSAEQVATVIGSKVFASVTSYVQPTCGSGVSIALGLAVPARRQPNRYRAVTVDAGGRVMVAGPMDINLPAGQDGKPQDRVLFADGALFTVTDPSGPRSNEYGVTLQAAEVL